MPVHVPQTSVCPTMTQTIEISSTSPHVCNLTLLCNKSCLNLIYLSDIGRYQINIHSYHISAVINSFPFCDGIFAHLL